MNKIEAMKAMIEGKKVVEKSKGFLHYYYMTESGRFMYVMTNGQETMANMQDHDDYEILVVKKSISKVVYITKRAAATIMNLQDRDIINFTLNKGEKSSIKLVMTWEHVGE